MDCSGGIWILERLPRSGAQVSVQGTDANLGHQALNSLATFDERKCKIIELRYFAGLSIEEVAEALEISVATVGRNQRLAEAWLKRYMTDGTNE